MINNEDVKELVREFHPKLYDFVDKLRKLGVFNAIGAADAIAYAFKTEMDFTND